LKSASGEVIVFLSNDIEVDAKWLKQILDILDAHPETAIVQCNSLSLNDRRTHDSAMNFLDRYGYSYSYFYNTPNEVEVFFAEGMAFAVRRSVVQEIGFLDPYYFMEYDDMDFCWRARLAGYKVFFAPRSIVYHARGGYSGPTIFSRRSQNIFTYTRNQMVTLLKNYSLRNFALAFPLILLGNTLKIIVFLVNRNLRAISVIRAYYAFMADLRQTWKTRLLVQRNLRKVGDGDILRSMVRFNPSVQRLFLARQSAGKRLILDGKPNSESKAR
jgi:GT2 family glycosyltransferase